MTGRFGGTEVADALDTAGFVNVREAATVLVVFFTGGTDEVADFVGARREAVALDGAGFKEEVGLLTGGLTGADVGLLTVLGLTSVFLISVGLTGAFEVANGSGFLAAGAFFTSKGLAAVFLLSPAATFFGSTLASSTDFS